MYNELVTNCKAQEGASDLDVQEMAMHQPPSTYTGQCLNACAMEAVGIVRKMKRFSPPFSFYFTTKIYSDERWEIVTGRMY